MALIDDLATAIQRMEGWAPGSVSFRNNNPGNLRPLGAGRTWAGQIGVDSGGYVVFDGYASGLAALKKQIGILISRGLTLTQFFAGQRDASGKVVPGGYSGYAPAADHNQPNVYAGHVGSMLNLPSDVPLNTLSLSTVGAEIGSPLAFLPSLDSLPTLPDVAAVEAAAVDLGWPVLAGIGVLVFSALYWLFK
jgi:hypothetical protein